MPDPYVVNGPESMAILFAILLVCGIGWLVETVKKHR